MKFLFLIAVMYSSLFSRESVLKLRGVDIRFNYSTTCKGNICEVYLEIGNSPKGIVGVDISKITMPNHTSIGGPVRDCGVALAYPRGTLNILSTKQGANGRVVQLGGAEERGLKIASWVLEKIISKNNPFLSPLGEALEVVNKVVDPNEFSNYHSDYYSMNFIRFNSFASLPCFREVVFKVGPGERYSGGNLEIVLLVDMAISYYVRTYNGTSRWDNYSDDLHRKKITKEIPITICFKEEPKETPIVKEKRKNKVERKKRSYSNRNLQERDDVFNRSNRIVKKEENFYHNGKLCERAYLIKGTRKLHGLYEAWFENGQLKYKGFYKNGKKWKEYKEWYSNGKKKAIDYYDRNGKIHGKSINFDRNGKKKSVITYEHGRLISQEAYQ